MLILVAKFVLFVIRVHRIVSISSCVICSYLNKSYNFNNIYWADATATTFREHVHLRIWTNAANIKLESQIEIPLLAERQAQEDSTFAQAGFIITLKSQLIDWE